MNILLAFAVAAAVAAAGWRTGALSRGGAVAGTAVGGCVLGFGGLGAGLVLVLFFVTSSALSALPGRPHVGDGRERRDARQVAANGSVAALAAALAGAWEGWALALAGAVAAATADTWATEVGVRFGARPRSILTLEPRPPGSSGAVSVPGTLASVAGGVAVAVAAAWWIAGVGARGGLAVAAGGVAGSLFDSVLGAGIQATYRCPTCGATPEVPGHAGCPDRARRETGLPGFDNDVVNWVATAVGALVAFLLGWS